MTFGDVLQRVPDLAVTHARTLRERGRCFFVRVKHTRTSDTTEMEIRETPLLGLPTIEEVREALRLPESIAIARAPYFDMFAQGQEAITFTFTDAETVLDEVVTLAEGEDAETFLVVEDPGCPRLSVLLSLYLVAFFTATLARYHSSIWMTFLTPGKGDGGPDSQQISNSERIRAGSFTRPAPSLSLSRSSR
jgi:hypothetical protein